MSHKCILAAVLLAAAGTPATAQQYETRVIARGLERPTGIAALNERTVYFTELPTPGVGGRNGGSNAVSALDPRTGRVRPLVTGEPEPTNLAVDFFGGVYWTCKSAGVINTLDRYEQVETLFRGLDAPTGIAAYPLGFFLFFTEVPTPGVGGEAGGMNRVSAALAAGGLEFPIDVGDPEPTDVAVGLDGAVYWTCSSAGVIVRLAGGRAEVILRGLDRPTGIALDHAGNLYFTEVPTPGVGGADGGTNAVYKYDLKRKVLTVIDEGDPEPTDVTALGNGTVYWTCSSAGVIVEAKPVRAGR